jgi:hypothetical protein
MQIALVILAAALMAAGCGSKEGRSHTPRDAQLTSKLIGSWVWNRGHLVSVLTFSPDGSFSFDATNTLAQPVRAWRFQGTWEVAEGLCVTKTLKRKSWGYANSGPPPDSLERSPILRLDDTSFVFESMMGQTNMYTRRR